MASKTERRNSDTGSPGARRQIYGRESWDWTPLVQNEEVVLGHETSLLDNFTRPRAPSERHAVYYEYKENVSASDKHIYGNDRYTRLPRKKENATDGAENMPPDIVETIASGPQLGAVLQVAYANPSF